MFCSVLPVLRMLSSFALILVQAKKLLSVKAYRRSLLLSVSCSHYTKIVWKLSICTTTDTNNDKKNNVLLMITAIVFLRLSVSVSVCRKTLEGCGFEQGYWKYYDCNL